MLSFAQKRVTTAAARTMLSRRAMSATASRRVMLGEGDSAKFQEHVVKGNNLTIVDFHAEWCPPCKMLDPVLEKVMKDDKDADYLKIDTDNEAELAAKYKVSSLPTVIAFKHGKEFSRFVGFVNEEAVRNFLENAKS